MQTADWQLLFSDRFTGARNPARLPTLDAIPSNPLRPPFNLSLPPRTIRLPLLAGVDSQLSRQAYARCTLACGIMRKKLFVIAAFAAFAQARPAGAESPATRNSAI
jgi:hypothetical protein